MHSDTGATSVIDVVYGGGGGVELNRLESRDADETPGSDLCAN